MKQKSILWSMLAIIMVAMLSVGFSACGDDGDENDKSNSVVGTWTGRDGYHRLTLTFSSNNTGTILSIWDDEPGRDTDTVDFKYVMESKNEGTITYEELDSGKYYTKILYFRFEGTTMYLSDPYYNESFTLTKQ